MERLTEGERSFLRAMSRVETEPIRIAAVAEELGVPVSSLSPRRGALIRKGMVYGSAHGEIAYTVPLFGEFLRRSGARAPQEALPARMADERLT